MSDGFEPLSGGIKLGDIPLGYLRRGAITFGLAAALLVVFFVMIHEMVVAAILGVIIGAYLRPVHVWLARRTSSPASSAVITIGLSVAPALALMAYGYLELRRAAIYLKEHIGEVAGRIESALERLPFVADIDPGQAVEPILIRVGELATRLPEGVQEQAAEWAIDTSVFLFTAFYVLTQSEVLIAYLRGKVPRRYGAFAEKLESNLQGVLYGAVYATFLAQTLKALLVLALNLAFGVPLPVALALLAFVIGFFPIVGSWTIFVPAAGYLLVFKNEPWQALAMVVIGFTVSTVLISLVMRPKIAAERSKVLNFYWMFIALVAGVYTFGIAGIVIGPIVVGLLKALLDTLTTELVWERSNGDAPEAKVFKKDEVGQGSSPERQAGTEDEEDEEDEGTRA